MKIVLYQSWPQIVKLQTQWARMLAQSTSNTFFLTWEWCESWWQTYAGKRQPFVLAAWDTMQPNGAQPPGSPSSLAQKEKLSGAQPPSAATEEPSQAEKISHDDTEKLIGIAPFMSDVERRAGRSWKVLRFISDRSDDSDYLDGFAVKGHERQFSDAVIAYLDDHRNLWDYLELHGPVSSSPLATAIVDQLQARDWRHTIEDVPCLTLKLPADWNQYVQTLKPRFRTKIRSSMSFFEQQTDLSITECKTEAQIDEWLPVFFDLHGKRWQSKGRAGVFTGEAKREFYSCISRAALRSGTLSFHQLNWGERTLAFQYGFIHDNKFLLLQEAYDPAFESLRPGLALRGFRLRDMISAGIQEYDFLAGMAQHKADWGAEQKRSLKISFASSAIAELVFLKAPAARQHVKTAVRKCVPDAALRLRQRLYGAQPPGPPSSLAQKEKLTGAQPPWPPTRAGVAHKENLYGPQPPSAATERSSQAGNIWNDSSAKEKASPKTILAKIYASTPLHNLGRRVADGYQLVRRSGSRSFSIGARKESACQILLYHRVNDDRDPFLPSLPVREFRAQMEYIAKKFNVISLDDIASGRISTDGSKYSMAITFDDGYRDNFSQAFPILKELGLPATIYLATGYIGTGKLPWYDQVCLAFKLTMRQALDCRGLDNHNNLYEVIPNARKASARFLQRASRAEESAPSKAEVNESVCSATELPRKSLQAEKDSAPGATTIHPLLKLENEDAPCGPLQSQQQRLELLERTLEWLRSLPNETRIQRMQQLFRALGVNPSLTLPNYMLSWDEIRQMKAHKICFGAHTVTHPVLSQVSGSSLQKEIADSKKTIEQKLQTEVRHFAYPFGRPNHVGAEARAVVEQAGFQTAVTTVYGFNAVGDDSFALKRFTPWGPGKANFILQHDWNRFVGIPSPPPVSEPAAHLSGTPGRLRKAEL